MPRAGDLLVPNGRPEEGDTEGSEETGLISGALCNRRAVVGAPAPTPFVGMCARNRHTGR